MGPPCTTYRTEIISSMPCRDLFPTFLIPLIPASHTQSTNPLDTVGLGCRRRRLFGSHCQLSQTLVFPKLPFLTSVLMEPFQVPGLHGLKMAHRPRSVPL